MDAKVAAISRGLQTASPPAGKNLRDYENEWLASSPVLQKIGINISDARSTPVDLSTIENASIILAMDKSVLIEKSNSLSKQFPQHGYKMRLFTELVGDTSDVQDVYGSKDQKLHRRVIEMIHSVSTDRLDALLNYVELFQF